MEYIKYSCLEFIELLSSKKAVPGGGGAAALTGAIGMALGMMVCNLTKGKKKYAKHEEKINSILKKADEIKNELEKMIDEDAKCFLPLSKVYSMKAVTEEEKIKKEEIMEEALVNASEVPVEIGNLCFDAIKLHEELVEVGSKIAISDVGVGVQCLRSALISAQLNVLINTSSMKNKAVAERIEKEIENKVKDGVKIADRVYEKVVNQIIN